MQEFVTESFRETGGEPLAIQKAKSFRRQCQEKTIKIWDQELIVGCAGSKMRGGILSADTCWSILDKERGLPYNESKSMILLF